MSVKPTTYVLVAGSWLGAWYWHRVAERLKGQGHRVYMPTLTGLAERSHLLNASVNLTTHIQDVANLIKWEQLDNIVLCGHSYAGMVISGVAECVPEGTIRSIVYLDAVYAQSGKSLVDYFPQAPMTEDGGLTTPVLPGALFGFDDDTARMFDKLTTPHPLASWEEKSCVSGKRDKIKSKWFVLATNSGMPIFADMVKELLPKSEWLVERLSCAHMVALELPKETGDILLRAAKLER